MTLRKCVLCGSALSSYNQSTTCLRHRKKVQLEFAPILAEKIRERYNRTSGLAIMRSVIRPTQSHELAGAIVYRRSGKYTMFACILDVFGYWTFARGHREREESDIETALREAKEELGIADAQHISFVGKGDYETIDHQFGVRIKKQVAYHLFKIDDERLVSEKSGGICDAQWFRPEDLKSLRMYDEIRALLYVAIELIEKNEKSYAMA